MHWNGCLQSFYEQLHDSDSSFSPCHLQLLVLLIFQFTAAVCTCTWVLGFWISEFHPVPITLPPETQLILSIKYLDLSIILASEALHHPKLHTIIEFISTLLKVLCKPSDHIMPLGVFLLGLLQLDVWKTHNGPTTKMGEGPAVVHVKQRKLLNKEHQLCLWEQDEVYIH